jgi:hypothetical protein
MMDGSMPLNIVQYAERNQLKIARRLGFGIHGSVFSATYPNGAIVAIKHHTEEDPFYREFEVYCRLDELKVKEVGRFVVPRLINVDEALRILEITIVSRPFILDFGGAYLDVNHPSRRKFGKNGRPNAAKNTGIVGLSSAKYSMRLRKWTSTSLTFTPAISRFAIKAAAARFCFPNRCAPEPARLR